MEKEIKEFTKGQTVFFKTDFIGSFPMVIMDVNNRKAGKLYNVCFQNAKSGLLKNKLVPGEVIRPARGL